MTTPIPPKRLSGRWKRRGHEACAVNDGESALNKVKFFLPDIILCDINMPGINGYDVCKKLKTDNRLKNTLIFAQTAYDTVDKKMRSIDAGFDYHFVKPVDIRKLTNFIETALHPEAHHA